MSDYYEMLERNGYRDGYENGLRAGRAESAQLIAAAKERGRRSGVEERDKLRAGMLRLLRDGYGPGGGFYEPDQRVAAAISLLEVGWGFAPRDSAPARDPYVEAGVDDWSGAPRDSGKEPDNG